MKGWLIAAFIALGVLYFHVRNSDRIEREERERNVQQAAIREAAAPTRPKSAPPEGPDMPIRFYTWEKALAAEYRFKLVVYEMPDGVSLVPAPPRNAFPWPYLRNGEPYPISELKEVRTISFKHTHSPIYRAYHGGPNLFVCNWLLKEDGKCVRAELNSAGEHDQFCGIVSIAGDIIYQFPVLQSVSDRLAQPLLVTADGKKAGLVIGKIKTDDADCGYESVGDYSEVMIWNSTDSLKKYTGPQIPSQDWRELRDQVYTGKL